MNIYNDSMNETDLNHDLEVDKDLFLRIIANAFDKIIVSMHPKVGSSLN